MKVHIFNEEENEIELRPQSKQVYLYRNHSSDIKNNATGFYQKLPQLYLLNINIYSRTKLQNIKN